uniref:Uncharacterized protein n=1 Tax=Euplotes harpa TaxID=151035 RepID=A0A7S3JM06_9SPIT
MESMDSRYNSKAVEFYRRQLRALCAGKEFKYEQPDYETGRQPVGEGDDFLASGKKKDGDKATELLGQLWSGTKKAAAAGAYLANLGVNKMNK